MVVLHGANLSPREVRSGGRTLTLTLTLSLTLTLTLALTLTLTRCTRAASYAAPSAHRARRAPTSRLYLVYVSLHLHISRLHLPYISPISPLYLGEASATFENSNLTSLSP